MNDSNEPTDRPPVDWAAVLRQAQGDQLHAADQEIGDERAVQLKQLGPDLSEAERDSIISFYYDDGETGETRDAIVAGLIEADTDPNADAAAALNRLMSGLFALFAEGWIAAIRHHGVLPANAAQPGPDDTPSGP
jgi:hypothetical protein